MTTNVDPATQPSVTNVDTATQPSAAEMPPGNGAAAAEAWPELPWRDWTPTLETVHMWSQIVGKVRMALAPPLNHWWHVTLYATAHGLTTSPMPVRGSYVAIDFDLVRHRLDVTTTDGASFILPLEPKSVATFYREILAGLHGLGVDVRIWPRPVEVVEAIPFESDDTHATYYPDHATAFWRGLVQADRVLKAFQSDFLGKASPVHFFWGGFDVATSRYSGRTAPKHPGGIPNCPDWVMQEAYSHEEMAAGWWPLNSTFGPAFYAYAYPEPAGMRDVIVPPPAARYDQDLGEFILTYDAVRGEPDPDAAALAFLRSTYEAAANLGRWDRASLERRVTR